MNKNIIPTVLLIANIVCAIWLLSSVQSILKTEKTYVLTPFLKVVPENTEWTVQEIDQLKAQIPTALEARDMAGSYSHLGSTLSIDDVLRGIDSLEKSQSPLTEVQRLQIGQEVASFTNAHREIRAVQMQLVEIEQRMFKTLQQLKESR